MGLDYRGPMFCSPFVFLFNSIIHDCFSSLGTDNTQYQYAPLTFWVGVRVRI